MIPAARLVNKPNLFGQSPAIPTRDTRLAPAGRLIVMPAAIDHQAAAGGAQFEGQRTGMGADAQRAAGCAADIEQDRGFPGLGAVIAGMRGKTEGPGPRVVELERGGGRRRWPMRCPGRTA